MIDVVEYLMSDGCWSEDRRDSFETEAEAVKAAEAALDAELLSLARLREWTKANGPHTK